MAEIKKQIEINAPIESVWRYLSDHDLLAAWLMRNDFQPEVGKAFQFHEKPSGNWNGVLDCKVVELDPPRRIAFTWNANSIGVDTLVSIDLEQVGTSTKLTLNHTNWAGAIGDVDAHIESHSDGWSKHLAILENALDEAGEDRPAPPIDWTRFKLHVSIAAEPSRVLEAWTTSAGMESFFVEMMQVSSADGTLRDAGEPAQEGDRFIWRWNSGRCISGEYLPRMSDTEATFTFDESKVCVRVHPYLDGTLLELEQFDIQDTPEGRMHVHTNCRGAWVYFLTVLKTWIEHGVDGRDKTRATGASFSTYFDLVVDDLLERSTSVQE